MSVSPLFALPTPLGDLDVDGWSVLWALLIGVGSIVAAHWVSSTILRLGHRVSEVPDDTVLGAARVVRYLIYMIGLGFVLSVLGAAVRPLLVVMLVLAGAVVLLGRGIADNLGAGLLIQTRRTVKLGDLIECAGHRGHISDLNSRSVEITTLDGVTIHIPNKQVLDGALLNFSTRAVMRSEVEVRASMPGLFDVDSSVRDAAPSQAARPRITALIKLVIEAALSVRGVRDNPAVDALVIEVDPDRVVLHLRIWHAADAQSLICSRTVLAVTEAVDAAGLVCALRWPPADAPLTQPGDL